MRRIVPVASTTSFVTIFVPAPVTTSKFQSHDAESVLSATLALRSAACERMTNTAALQIGWRRWREV